MCNGVFFNEFIAEALEEAKRGAGAGEVPVGAIVVMGGKIIARAHNEVEMSCDPTAHAELIVIREAAAFTGNWRLSECDLYVTLEPCPMCAWAITKARIRRLYFGSYDKEYGAAGSNLSLVWDKCEIYGGISENICDAILKSFFNEKRT